MAAFLAGARAERPEPYPVVRPTLASRFLGHRLHFEVGRGVLYNEFDAKYLGFYDEQAPGYGQGDGHENHTVSRGAVGVGLRFMDGNEDQYGEKGHILAMIPHLSGAYWSRKGFRSPFEVYFMSSIGPVLNLDHPDSDEGLLAGEEFYEWMSVELCGGMNMFPASYPSFLLEFFFNTQNFFGARFGVSLFRPAKAGKGKDASK